ncbi:MAG TPA: PepSY domain-containing protein [Noviherbaspirillum sp.]|nr:PepSY domain-containing protein [Noviherbaspirillum sp.]
MKSFFPLALVIALAGPGAALASDHCRRPMVEWQSRETVTAHVAERGITSERLRIDDGCYEVRGRDDKGNQVELKVDPASLAILELRVRFGPGGDTSRYLPVARSQMGKTTKPEAGKVQNVPGAAPTGSN